MLKNLYIFLSVLLYIVFCVPIVTLLIMVTKPNIFGILAVVVVFGLLTVNAIVFVCLELKGRKLISWWPTGPDLPVSIKLLWVICLYLVLGYVLYKGFSANPNWPNWLPLM
jgi:hypothetical protein